MRAGAPPVLGHSFAELQDAARLSKVQHRRPALVSPWHGGYQRVVVVGAEVASGLMVVGYLAQSRPSQRLRCRSCRIVRYYRPDLFGNLNVPEEQGHDPKKYEGNLAAPAKQGPDAEKDEGNLDVPEEQGPDQEKEDGTAFFAECENELDKTFQKLLDLPNPRLAIMGKRGVGKTTLANSLRRLSPRDRGASPVGADETTVGNGNVYNHLGLKIQDLPGCEGSEVSVPLGDEYIRKYALNDADGVLFVYTDVLEPRMVKLALKLRNFHDVPVFFVRNMVGRDCRNEVEDGNAQNLQEAFDKIKGKARKQILSAGSGGDVFADESHLFLVEGKYGDAVAADPPLEPFQHEFHRLRAAIASRIHQEAKRAQVNAILRNDAAALAKARVDICRRRVAGYTWAGALGTLPIVPYVIRRRVVFKFMEVLLLTPEALKGMSSTDNVMKATFGQRAMATEVLEHIALNTLGMLPQALMMREFCFRTMDALQVHAEKFYRLQMISRMSSEAAKVIE